MSFKICLVIAALFGSVSVGSAKGHLPECPGSPKVVNDWKEIKNWHNCIGQVKYGTCRFCSTYYGEFKKNARWGYGLSTYPQRGFWNKDQTYTGEFKDNKNHGYGEKVISETKIQKGMFYFNEFKPDQPYSKRFCGSWEQCGATLVEKAPTSVQEPTLKKYFNLRIISERKLIQSNLKDLGFYKFSIDGLYGKGTSSALEGYNKKYMNSDDLEEIGNVAKLIKAVLANFTTKVTPTSPSYSGSCRINPSSIKNCSDKVVCKWAEAKFIFNEDGSVKFKIDKDGDFVNVEARRRGLSCTKLITKKPIPTPKVAPTPTPKVVEVPKPITESETVKFKRIKKELSLSYYGGFIHSDRLPNTLFFFTDIKKNDSLKFRKALRNHDIDLIVLSSPGGSVFEGLQIAGIIHDKKLKTYIPNKSLHDKGNCASACSFMFFAGESRSAEGDLGVHQFYSTKASDEEKIGAIQEDAQFTVSEIIGFLNEFETPAWVYERMFQQADMYYFKESELLQLETEVSEETTAQHEKAERFISDFRSAFVKVKD